MRKIKWLLCVLVFSLAVSFLTVSAKASYVSEMLNASENSRLSLVSSEGWVGYHNVSSVDSVYSEDTSLTLSKLDSKYDLDGDGTVSVSDVENYLSSSDISPALSDYFAYAQGATDEKLVGNKILKYLCAKAGAIDVSWDSFVDKLTFNKFLELYPTIACLYAKARGESVNKEADGVYFNRLWVGEDINSGFYFIYPGLYETLGVEIEKLIESEAVALPGDASDTWDKQPLPSETSESTESSELGIEKDDSAGWLNDYLDKEKTDEGVELPDGSDLEYSDTKALTDWVSGIKDDKTLNSSRVVRVAMIITGVILLVYGLLLFLCFWLDRFNNLIDISFLSLISFGRFMASSEDSISTFKDKGKGVRLLKTSDIVRISLEFILLGVLVLSGVLSRFVWMIYVFFTK